AEPRDADAHEQAREPLDLLVAQDRVVWQELEVPAEDLLGHAVGTAEVAAVGHGDPEVAKGAPERVEARRPAVERRRGAGRGYGARLYHREQRTTSGSERRFGSWYLRATGEVPLATSPHATAPCRTRSTR